MTAAPEKAPRKEKPKRQTPEERQEALRYNHIMYGPTAGEMRPPAKKIDFGAPYLAHPKFQNLMTAFKKGTAFQFSVTDKGKSHVISTEEAQILFNGKVIYYSRSLNRYESDLLLDRAAAIQFQAIDAFVHLAIAVLRSLPELGTPQLGFRFGEFWYGLEKMEPAIAEQGPNLRIGSYRVQVPKEKGRS
ncbi:MAG TPA: hypothetical protein VN436_13935 [Holophaga sp.]|nr:hypothetical protein [Holophaga sp.]